MRVRMLQFVCVIVLVFALFPLATGYNPHVHAAGVVGDGTPASCTETALDTALSSGGDVTFNCGAELHTISVSSTKVVANNDTVRIDGDNRITISGNNSVRVFQVESGGTLSLNNITISGGNAGSESGGAIHNSGGVVQLLQARIINNNANEGGAIANVNDGVVEVVSSTIADNTAQSGGGAIQINSGTTTVRKSTLSGNTVADGGGGAFSYYIWNADLGGPLTIEQSTIANNSAKLGGAIAASGGAGPQEVRITNSTFVGNTASNSGAIYTANTKNTITNCTFAENSASEYIDGIFNSGGTLTLVNTILANDPTTQTGNCANESGTWTNGGGNIQFPDNSCGDDIPVAEPLLAPLADNGGNTQTMATGAGSPAIDAGVGDSCPQTDQRGETRPTDGNADGTPACDSGAYELQADEQPPSADNVVGDGTPASCTEEALREAVQRSGTITFNCGDAPHTITVSDDVHIIQDTVMDGGGPQQGGRITISGGNSTRVFVVDQHRSFTVKNLTIKDGKEPGEDGSGSGIRTGWRTTLTVENSIFENNDGTSGNQERGGGAIATDSECVLVVKDSLFRNNTGINGGAINNLLTDLTIENSVFEHNDSTAGAGIGTFGAGGALYTDGASKHDGTTSGQIVLRDTVFRGNKSVREGGAAFTWIYPPDAVIVERCTFDGNVVEDDGQGNAYGGGLRHGNGDLTIRDTLFANNVARSQGGAFWTDGFTHAQLTNITFVGNRAVEDEATGEGGLGGAVAGVGNFTCTNCTIANNHAGSYAGGIYGDSSITIQNTLFAHNTADNEWDINLQCSEHLNDGGNNIQFPDKQTDADNDHTCAATITIADPLLAELADNGGPNHTMALQPGSPALDAGNADTCPDADQRGVSRPADGDEDGTAQCDMGAYEHDRDATQPEATPTPTTAPIEATPTPTTAPIEATPTPTATSMPAQPPDAPSQLQAHAGKDSVLLTWNPAPTAGIAGYIVYRQQQGADSADALHTDPVQTLHYRDTGVPAGTYTYVVRAINDAGLESESVDITPVTVGHVRLSIPPVYAQPGTTASVPVQIEHGDGLCIMPMDIGITYHTDSGTVIGVRNTPFTDGYTFKARTQEHTTDPYSPYGPGMPYKETHISTTGCQELFGPGSLFWLDFSVPPTATTATALNFVRGMTGTVQLFDFDVDNAAEPIPLLLEDGQLQLSDTGAHILGDLNGNGVVEQSKTEDAAIALEIATGEHVPTPAQLSAGDVNGDGIIDAADATMMLFYGIQQEWPTVKFFAFLSANTVEVYPEVVTGTVGMDVGVPVVVSDGESVAGSTMVVRYGDGLSYLGVELDESLALDYVVQDNAPDAGEVWISLAGSSALQGDLQALITLQFRVENSATDDTAWVEVTGAWVNDQSGRDFATSARQKMVQGGRGGVDVVIASEEPDPHTYVFLPLVTR